MIIKLIALIAIAILLHWATKRYKQLTREERKAFLLKAALFGVAILLLIGVATGRMHWIGAIVAAMLPLFRIGFAALLRLFPFWLSRSGGIAPFKTEFLDVKIHIQSGQLHGQIISGPHTGKMIEDLTNSEIDELLEHYKENDLKSYYLMKFSRKSQQSSSSQQQSAPSFSNPSRDEALQILGLTGNPSKEDIIAAHRRLINKLHPDRGGSDFLAARVNQARDILLNEKNR